jgi:hypothetical protein
MNSMFDRVNGSCRPRPVQPWASRSSKLGAHVGFKTLNVVRRQSAVEDILALGAPQ